MGPGSRCRALSGPRLTGDTPTENPKAAIRDRALALGFDAVGFAPADQDHKPGERLIEFLNGGGHGDMGWLEARAEQRRAPRALWPEVKSVIVVGLNYGPENDPLEILSKPERGAISVYARGRDYHDVIKKKLRVLAREIHQQYEAEVKLFVDTAPVMEKPLAQSAGLGWQGKHTNLVSRQRGSWLFLGEIFTTLELREDTPETDHCGSCSRCLDICPTKAFPAPYRLDARRCISYLTIEHKGPIPHEFREAIGNRIFGCDDCLAVCPWNRFAKPRTAPELEPHIEKIWPRLGDLVMLDDTAFRDVFAGSSIKRLGRDRFIRNVLIAIGNSGDAGYRTKIFPLLDDQSPLVRGSAAWALKKLVNPSEFTKIRDSRLKSETDPEVLREWA